MRLFLLRLNVDETEFDFGLSGYCSHEHCLFLALKINPMFSSNNNVQSGEYVRDNSQLTILMHS